MEWQDYLKTNLVGRAMGYPATEQPSSPAIAEQRVSNDSSATKNTSKSSSMVNNCGTVVSPGAACKKSPPRMEPYVEYVANGTRVKPMLRPLFPCSKKNQDTFERQEQRDKQKFVASGHKYWAQMGQAYHHHHKAELEGKPCPEEHVYADRGRHKPEWCRSSSIFDPITSTSRPIGSPDKRRVEMRPSSAPHMRPKSATTWYDPATQQQLDVQRRPGTAREIQGRYNPLTHTWIEQPDTAAQAVKQKQADRIYGRVGIRTCNIPNSPNTGSGAAEVLSLDAPAVESSAAADTNFFLASGPNSSTGASIGGASGSGSSRGASSTGGSSSGSGRRCQSAPRTVRDHGDTWGTYDCLHHKWISPPSNKKYVSREAAPNGVSFDGGSGFSHTKKVPMPASQGVYNPITGQWKVLPGNRRAAKGLDFAPTKMFTKQAFTSK